MRRSIVILAVMAATACAPTTPDDRDGAVESEIRPLPGPSEQVGGEGLAAIEMCDAEDYRPLVGQNVSSASFPTGPMLRVFGANDIVTQDYVPQRTNVVYDSARIIVRIYCG